MRALVTGGGGFVGGAIVRELVARGWQVRSLGRSAEPALAALGVEHLRADLGAGTGLEAAVRGCDAVFHAAAKVGIGLGARDFFRTNVEGTRALLAACVAEGVPRFVHTSSPSVCFDGRDHRRASNDLPQAARFRAPYAASKAAAEELVLAANGRAGLLTCALRPHLVFGPGDPHLLPRLVERARAGRLVVVGRGDNEVTLCYVENAAHAHVLAAERLAPGAPHAGRAYFLGQREPVLLWPWIASLLGALDIRPPRRRLPLPLASAAGLGCELLWRLLRLPSDPPMTRFLALQLARSHSYDIRPAEQDFGYQERIPMSLALERSIAWLRSAPPHPPA